MIRELMERFGFEDCESESDGSNETGYIKETFHDRRTGRLLLFLRPSDPACLAEIADGARRAVPVLLSLERLQDAERQRVLDYCRGLRDGLLLEFSSLSDTVYLLAPESVDITGEGSLPYQEVMDFGRPAWRQSDAI